MNTRIDHSGINLMLDILCGRYREIFRYYYIRRIPKESIILKLGIDENVFKRCLNVIKLHIRKYLIYKKCEKCGHHYYTPNAKSTICERCQQGEFQEIKPKVSQPKQQKPAYKPTGIKCPHEILRRKEEYNRKHNTDLSYGYYVLITGE